MTRLMYVNECDTTHIYVHECDTMNLSKRHQFDIIVLFKHAGHQCMYMSVT